MYSALKYVEHVTFSFEFTTYSSSHLVLSSKLAVDMLSVNKLRVCKRVITVNLRSCAIRSVMYDVYQHYFVRYN
jgi:hypothetical protein